MAHRWTDADAIKLIELYKTYHFLWDSNHRLYKNHMARTKAYESIMEQMNKPNITVQDIRCKIKNLRSSYYQEVKKVSRAQDLGLEYTPTLPWFDYVKDIMDTVVHHQTEVQSESDGSFEFMEENSTNSDAYVVSIKQEYLDEFEKQDSKNVGTAGDYFEPAGPATKRIKLKTGFKERKEEKKEISRKDIDSVEIDEFQLFANNMAEQLRKLPVIKALNLQLEVQSLVAKARIEVCKKEMDSREEDKDDIE